MTPIRTAILVSIALTCAACGDTIVNIPTQPSQVQQTPTTPPVVKSTVEFRVTGNPTSVRVRFSAPSDGISQVVTTLPYTTSFSTTADTLFLSLDATPIAYSFATDFPFLSIRILVNGAVFREATSNEFLLHTLAIDGTWRR